MSIYLVEVGAHNGASALTLYLATEGYTSRPTDVPPNTFYMNRLVDPGNFQRALFSGGSLRGPSAVGSGNVVVVNGDPGNGDVIDGWLDYGFDGRAITIKRLGDRNLPLASAQVLFRGTCEWIESTDAIERLEIRISDRLTDLDKPLLTTRYAGTTTSTGLGIEGNSDLKDQTKPRIWGQLSNQPCVLVNPYDLIYQLSDGALFSIVAYDSGIALTSAGDFGNLAALMAWVQVPGRYATCLALGIVRLGGAPAGTVTADVVEGSSAANRTAAQIARRMLLAFGIPAADLPTGSFAALDSLNSAVCGIRVEGETPALMAVQQVLDSVGGWIVPDTTGAFQVGRLSIPTGTPVATFDENTLLTPSGTPGGGLQRLAVENDGKSIPAWRVTVRYDRIGVVQGDAEVAGGIEASRRSYLASEWRETAASNASIKTKHPNAPELIVETCLVSATAAAAEAARLLPMHGARRDRYQARVHMSEADGVVPGSIIKIEHERLGLSAGKLFAVLGRVDEYVDDLVTLDVWG